MRRFKLNFLKKKINISNFLFYTAYILMLIYYMGSNIIFLQNIQNKILILSYLLLVINFVVQSSKYKVKSIILIVLCIVISLISWKVSNSSEIAVLIIFVVSLKNIKFNDIVSFDIKAKITLVATILIFYALGLTDVYYKYREDGRIRSSMGFSHPNIFGTYIFSICCEYIYLNYKKIKFYKVVGLVVVSFLVSYFSDSRTAQLSILIAVLFWCVFSKYNIFKYKVVNFTLSILFLILTIISYVLGVLYSDNNGFVLKLDELLTGRIKCIDQFINEYDVKLFGNELELVGTREAEENGISAKILDNAYIKILLQYGLVSYLLFFILLFFGIKNAIKEKNYALCTMFLVYMIYGIFENALFLIRYNVFLMYLSNLVFFKNKTKNDVSEEEKTIESNE